MRRSQERLVRALVVCGLLLASPIAVNAQNTAAAQADTVAEGNPAAGVPSSRLSALKNPASVAIAPGDLVDISVYGFPELAQEVRVATDGTAELALIGKTNLSDLTAQGAAELIARELRDRNFVLRPQVNILIKESSTSGVSVVGEVQHPGVYNLVGGRTLLDMISMAGGFTNFADTRITIQRRSGDTQNVTLKLQHDHAATSLANDVQIYPGDLVLVPRAGIVYVLGDVARPGGFVMQDNGKITVLEALAQAGGATMTAAPNRALLLRKTDNGYTTTKLHVDSIAAGKEADFQLQANDIVFLPNSRLKRAAHNTQSIVGSIGTTAIFAIMH